VLELLLRLVFGGVRLAGFSLQNEHFHAFTKLRKVTISFVMSARPSVHMEQLGSHKTDFHEI
jgi:hypothetical protein